MAGVMRLSIKEATELANLIEENVGKMSAIDPEELRSARKFEPSRS